MNKETKLNHSEKACVSLVPVFNHLTKEQMDEVMQVVQRKTFEKHETIYHATESADALYIVNRGQVKIYHLTESGKEQVIRILNPGDFTGELALFQESLQENYAEAMMDTSICVIKNNDLQQLLLKYPQISIQFLTEFANRLAHSEKMTTSFATEKVETRIALFLAECLDNTSNNMIELPMSKKDLASYLGTTPETLSRRLKQFEDEGIIKQIGQRKIEIIDFDELLFV